MKIPAKVDTSDFNRGLDRLRKSFSVEEVMSATRLVCEQILAESVDAPVPVNNGMLKGSATCQQTGPTEYSFGFNQVYAEFQDQPDRTGEVVVRPGPSKKFLYIPLTDRGEKDHYYGNNPKDEGLERGVDYVLAKEAHIKIKAYGSDKGPNHYFSGTWKRWTVEKVERAIGMVLRARFGRIEK